MDRQQLLALSGDDARDVFVEFFFPFRADEILATLDGKDNLDVDLRIGVGHKFGVAPLELFHFGCLGL